MDEIIEAMMKYTIEHPTHGYNSAGKDQYLQAARRWIRERPGALAEFLYLAQVLAR